MKFLYFRFLSFKVTTNVLCEVTIEISYTHKCEHDCIAQVNVTDFTGKIRQLSLI